MEGIKSYHVDEPVDRQVFTREDLIRYLDDIRDILIRNNVGMFDLSNYDFDAEYIKSCYDFLQSRLQHSECERFKL